MSRRYKKSSLGLGFWVAIVVLLLALVTVGFFIVKGNSDNEKNESSETSVSKSSENPVSVNASLSSVEASSVQESSSESQKDPTKITHNLDEDFSKLLLVNGENPLPEDYDYEGNLRKIPQKYLKGGLTQFDKDVYPYLKAMIDAAWKDNVEIYVWSPYRSYSIQKMLFENQTKKWTAKGYSRAKAEEKAASVVARPGTSEHHTGLALDINCADDSFEKTEGFEWLCENAEDYGFIMRYSKEKQPITGVIHESWHWRFVGIKHAKEINKLGYCLEEYVDHLEDKK